MNSEKQLKLDIISLLDQKKISLGEAIVSLDVSERTVLRYLEGYRKLGPKFVDHGNTGRSPVNKTSPEIIQRSKLLMKEKYFDFNMTHALEKLSSKEGIKINRETFRQTCHEIGLVKKAHRRVSKVRNIRDRMAQEGVMLQMDGSPHRWFGNVESCLIGAIDDATSEVLGAEFFEAENTIGCMQVLKGIIERRGLFSFLYTDKAGIFGGQKRINFSQVKRALSELGITIIFANSPQAKGRIERLWGTLQDRLVPEMRTLGISTHSEANAYLQGHYLQHEHNQRFKVVARNLTPAWKSLPPGINLNEVFCIKEFRAMKGDHTFSWNGLMFKVASDEKYLIKGQKIEVRTYLDGSWGCYFADRKIDVERHHIQPRLSVIETVQITEQEEDTIKVRKDSHIQYQNKYYSVDPKYIGQLVTVREHDGLIIIYHRKQMIESHARLMTPALSASTKPEHLGPWQKSLHQSSIYRKAAREIGVECDKLVFTILQRGQGIIDNKSIWAIIGLKKAYKGSAIEEACKKASELGLCNYRGVQSILNLRYKRIASNN